MAQRSLMLGRASGAGHSFPGAHLLDPLVHMFNPSFGTHVSSSCTGTHLSSYGTALADTHLCLGISILPISIHIQIFTGLNSHAPSVSHSLPGMMYTGSIFDRSIGNH